MNKFLFTLYFYKFRFQLFDSLYFRLINRVLISFYKWKIKNSIHVNAVILSDTILSGYVVSLTSFKQRISWVYIPIVSILLGKVRPEKILLYLSLEEFPGGLKDLPSELLQMQRMGLEILFREKNIKSHKKYRYAFSEFPDYKIITIDDDIVYPYDFLQRISSINEKLPKNSRVSFLAMKMEKVDSSSYLPYSRWQYVHGNETGDDILLMGGYGCLYNNGNCMMEHYNDEDAMKNFSTGDDIYLHYLGKRTGMINYVFGAEYARIFPILPWVQGSNLFEENIGGGKNDEMLRIMQQRLQ